MSKKGTSWGKLHLSLACLEWQPKLSKKGDVTFLAFLGDFLQHNQRNRITSGRSQREITQKQLATFRRDNTEIEAILRQQRHDRETRAALVVLEGGKKATYEGSPAEAEMNNEQQLPESSEKPKKSNPYENLLVLKRIQR